MHPDSQTETQGPRLIGVYHANGGLIGELTYVMGKLMGTTHCALCDVTHGMVRMKPEFRGCMDRWPITLLHLNEQWPALARFTDGHTPCVVMELDGHFSWVASQAELDSMAGNVDLFAEKVACFMREALR